MGGEENPSKREEKLGTPSCFRNPTPGTPLTSSSDGKSVLLFDWWLIKVDTDYNGKRLAVGGLTTRGGQQATRFFCSAPIIKRYDAYTLETSDGITVRIQGFINKTRTLHTGVPPEVCNCFLIGFPYNWNYYADEYFGKKSSSTSIPTIAAGVDEPSKHSSDSVDGIFPIHLDEFPMRKILDVITSTRDVLTRNFTDTLKKIYGSTSMDTTNQVPLDLNAMKASFPEETLSKNEMDKSHQNHKNSVGYACTIGCDAECHADGHAVEAGCHGNNLHADGVQRENSVVDKTANFSHDISLDSSLQGNTECNRLPETGMITQNKSRLENLTDPEKANNLVESLPAEFDLVDHLPNGTERKLNDDSTTNLVDLGVESLSNDLVLKKEKSSHLKHGRELGNYALRSRICLEKTGAHYIGVSKDLEVRKDSGTKDANSLTINMNTPLETMFKPLKFSAMKASLPEETLSKNAMDKSNQNHENSMGDDCDVEGHAADHAEEVGCHRNDLYADGVPRENSGTNETTNFSHDISLDGSLQVNTENNSLPETGMGVQKEPLLENITDPEKNYNSIESLPANFDAADHLPNGTERILNDESTTNFADLGNERVLSDLVLKKEKLSHLKHGQKVGNYALRSRICLKKTDIHNIGVSKDLQVRKDSDTKGADSLTVKMNVPLESSHVPLRNGVERNLNDDCTTNLAVSGIKSVSNDLLQKENNLSHLKHVKRQEKRGRPRKEKTGVNSIGFSEDLLLRKDSDKQDANSLTVKLNVPLETSLESDATKSYTASNMKVKSGRTRFSISLMDEINDPSFFPVSQDDGDLCHVEGEQRDVNYLRAHTDRYSGTSKESASKTGVCFLKEPLDKLIGEGGRDGSAILGSRLKNLKIKRKDDQTVKSRMEAENKIKSVTVDHNFPNAMNDVKQFTSERVQGRARIGGENTSEHVHGCARIGGEKSTLVSSPRESDTKIYSEHQGCSVCTFGSTDEMHKQGDGHARDQVGLHGSVENESFEFSVRSSVKHASHSNISANVHPSTDKVSDMIGKKIANKTNYRDGNQSEVLLETQLTKDRTLHRTRGKTVWRRSYEHVPQTPQTREMANKLSLASPESLNLRRSRSGRLLVPPIANWCQKIIYDADGAITGIVTGVDVLNSPCIGSKSKPPRKKKKLL